MSESEPCKNQLKRTSNRGTAPASGDLGLMPGPLRQLRAPSQRAFKQNLPGRFLTECQQVPAGRQQPHVCSALMQL